MGWDPEALRQKLIDFVVKTGFDGIAPLPKELRLTIADAEKVTSLVVYENWPPLATINYSNNMLIGNEL